MRRHRFMIVEHDVSVAEITEEKKFEDFVLPIHTMLGTYHWARLDDKHVFVSGYYEVGHHHLLHSHPKVSVLPILSSSKTLKTHLSAKVAHWHALTTSLGLSEYTTTPDLIEVAEQMFGPLFSADK